MKDISFVVPCYNSEAYMKKCIDSLLIGKNQIEIIIIDDGSTDKTGQIADNYQKKYPKTVKVIHQKNGGHGEGINTGLRYATGKYFKVVDSDDWLEEEAYKKLLREIKNIDTDLIVCNYVYTYTDGRKNQIISFDNVYDENKVLTWNDIHRFKMTQYPSLHSMMYKKSVLDKSNIDLPKHVFYEDNLFIYLPLVNTETIYYLNLNLYQYYIGRSDQSVQASQMIKRSHHQVLVSKRVCTAYDLNKIKNKKLRKLMRRECIFLMTIAVVFSRLAYSIEGEKQYKQLWRELKKENPKLYHSIRYTTIATFVSLPTRLGRCLSMFGYRLAHKLVKFN